MLAFSSLPNNLTVPRKVSGVNIATQTSRHTWTLFRFGYTGFCLIIWRLSDDITDVCHMPCGLMRGLQRDFKGRKYQRLVCVVCVVCVGCVGCVGGWLFHVREESSVWRIEVGECWRIIRFSAQGVKARKVQSLLLEKTGHVCSSCLHLHTRVDSTACLFSAFFRLFTVLCGY